VLRGLTVLVYFPDPLGLAASNLRATIGSEGKVTMLAIRSPLNRSLGFAVALAALAGAAVFVGSCGGSNGVNVGALCPSGASGSPARSETSPAMTTQEFCDLYIQTCSGANAPTDGYITNAECQAGFAALMFESTRECRSYHLCNSADYDTAHAALHCQHTMGIDLCGDTGP
jgi:hypothetical protein